MSFQVSTSYILVHVHMYADYDTKTVNFFPPSNLCMVVLMYPTPICDAQSLICDGDFLALAGRKSDDK